MREITCPSGMKAEVRGLKGKELKIFQDTKAARTGGFVDQILDACVVSMTDPGPYKISGDRPTWDDVLLGDKFYCLVQVRIETYGSAYEFTTQCPSCKFRFPWELDLEKLPVRKLSKHDQEAFKHGHALITKVPSDGREVKFRLSTGKDEKTAAKAKSMDNALVRMMSLRILELAGESDRNKIQAFVDDCELSDLTKLLKEFDKRDCGLETSFEVQCPECTDTKEINLPLGMGFWLPN